MASRGGDGGGGGGAGGGGAGKDRWEVQGRVGELVDEIVGVALNKATAAL